MPIASRTMDIQQHLSGVYASFRCPDDKGRVWYRSRGMFVDEAAAQTALDNHNWMPQLKRADFADLLAFVETPGRGNPNDFDLTDRDITLEEGEDFLYKLFAESEGGSAIKIAWWLKGMNNPTFIPIRNRAGHDNTEGDRVKDKAVAQDDAEATIDDAVEVNV